MNLNVAALVLTWNSADLIERCITSLTASATPPHVLVVDNASSDDTVARIRAHFPEVEILQTGENLGFAGGCNVGIRKLTQEGYASVFLLNPDAYVSEDCIDLLVHHLETADRCGAVSPLIYDHEHRVVWFAGSDVDWTTGTTYHRGQGDPIDAFDGVAAFATDRINGGAVLLRSSAIQEVGLFDEAYFLYYEETDLSVRLSRAGWGLDIVPDARASHEASSSTGGNLGGVYNYYLTRGRLHFLRKLGGSEVRWPLVFMHLARETRWLTKTFGIRTSMPALRARTRGVIDFARHREGRASI